MGRQHNNNNKKQSATDLVGFHLPSRPQQPRQQHASIPSSSRPRGNYNNRRKQQQHKSTPQDPTSARRKAKSAMFHLHTSADHAFCLTRRSGSKIAGKKYSYEGSDQAVSWESVRLVKQLQPLREKNESTCPICLDDFVCPRITKCGHTFCLSCLIHHAQSNAHSTNHARCPCCSIPMLLEDLRPLILETTIAPIHQKTIRLIKLHREKTCSTPYIPKEGCFKHSNPHAAPCMGDPDEKYSRFNYIDSSVYLNLLKRNQHELQEEEQRTPKTSFDHVFVKMALAFIGKEIQQATLEFPNEHELKEEIMKPTSGFYQLQAAEVESTPSFECDEETTNNSSSTQGRNIDINRSKRLGGSMYLDEASTFQFYQAEDGQLIFLNGFNMTLLMSDFSRSKPDNDDDDNHQNQKRSPELPPMPDFIHGRILEIERKNITSELRKRLSFLSYLPLFTDIIFVELDLNHILSEKTKQKFKGELAKRRKHRQSKVKAEKRENRALQREERARINDRKARLQLIDPDDAFFHSSALEEEPQLTAEDFSSTLVNTEDPREQYHPSPPLQPQAALGLSFSQACRRESGLVMPSTDAFPSLGSSVASSSLSDSKPRSSSWGDPKLIHSKPTTISLPGGGVKNKKKGKTKQRLLFSTGGQRGGGY